MSKPLFVIKLRFQKREETYRDILSDNILHDVCKRLTGKSDFDVNFEQDGYNKGRLAKLFFKETVYYISFSETEANGRNSSFQSVPSAFVQFFNEPRKNKKLYFYFLPTEGNFETKYFVFMYRLMKTVGFDFVNEEVLTHTIHPFISAEDVIVARDANRSKNTGNNSTYITYAENHTMQIYGKVYGANKYETFFICISLFNIYSNTIELYEICEQDLTTLPKPCRDILVALQRIRIISTNMKMERHEFEKGNSIRSPLYTYNLLQKFKRKKCAMCDCIIPEIIQGAHIWPVAAIKRISESISDKINYATDGQNGLWLCQNHHKLFDENIIKLDAKGHISYDYAKLPEAYSFIRYITTVSDIDKSILTPRFISYLNKRYESA